MSMIFQLGTNNWQVEGGGFAPGSGILHEAHHNAYNKMPNTKSFSVWPIPPKLTHEVPKSRTDYRLFKLEHDIPICESVSPVSSYRWHSMSETEFDAYRKRLTDFCYDFMNDAEKETGRNFDLFIAHHSFLNPLVGMDVLKRRKEAGKPDCHLCVFVHGTALKMYVHEKSGKEPQEYPLRFFPIMEKSGLFAKDTGIVSRIFAISAQQVDAFREIFPDFPADRVTISPNGIDFDIFHVPSPALTREQTLAEVKHTPYDGEPVAIPAGFDELVTFVGKFANWKRLDGLLRAAAIYEKEFEGKGKKVCTIIVGSGPPEAIKLYQDLALKELGLKYCYFLGPQPQPMLAKLYSVSSVGVFPSKAEPFGLVFVECMACRCPVIGANSGGPKDFVSKAVGELVPEPGSFEPADVVTLSKDLAKTITQALTENWKASKADACFQLAREKFGVTTQVLNLIQSVPPTDGTCDVAVVGLAVMGSNLALNIADKGFRVAVYNRTFATTKKFLNANAGYNKLHGCETMEALKKALKKPRRALILVKAGGPTDATIKQLEEVFEKDDIIVDTGNAHFRDQTRRSEELEAKGLRFLGMGISGGEEGARKGPAFFPGGTLSVWNDIKDVIEAASAKAEDGRPCAVMNGKGGAGSCVKMYHNAGEYAILQIWGEVFAIMRDWRVPAATMAQILTSWKTKQGGDHKNMLASYMLDITVEVVKMADSPEAGGKSDGSLLVDKTKDMVGSKGTGLWSVQEALGAGVPAPSLAEAVLSRQTSMYRDERLENAKKIELPIPDENGYEEKDVEDLFWAAGLSIIASYAQMFQCLRALDKEFEFGLNLPATIATFRAGCILQGYLLTPMTKAFEQDANLSSLLVAFSTEIKDNLPRFRRVMAKVVGEGSTSTPVMMSSLNYIQSMTSPQLAAGQAVALQRDVFGRHGFKRLDKEGDFNAQWPELQ